MSHSNDDERRKLKRRNLSYYLPVVNDRDQQVLGHLVDISSSGLMIDSKKTIPTQQDFNLSLELKEETGKKSRVSFAARSRWCRADPIQPFLYNVGFEIIDISSANSAMLQKIAEKYGTRDASSAAE